MDIVVWIVVAIVLGGVGFSLGRARGRATAMGDSVTGADARLRQMAEALARGRAPADAPAGSAESELHAAIRKAWVPREQERQAALQEAVGRVAAFLDREVRARLAGASASADTAELQERIGRALGALEDVDFYLREPETSTQGHNLHALVQQVVREFANDQDVAVRISLDDQPQRAEVNAAALMDALYLILHNAARFGRGGTIDVSVRGEGDTAHVVVRDRGTGFSEEAFERAFDPFYSTTDDGLGLGLPHARRVVEGMGGSIELRNVPNGGAEAEVTLPAAR